MARDRPGRFGRSSSEPPDPHGQLPPGVAQDRRQPRHGPGRRHRDDVAAVAEEKLDQVVEVVKVGTTRLQKFVIVVGAIGPALAFTVAWFGFKNQSPAQQIGAANARIDTVVVQVRANGEDTRRLSVQLDSTRQDFGLLAYVLCSTLTENSPQKVPRRCTEVLAGNAR
jgi:hypothetical protein